MKTLRKTTAGFTAVLALLAVGVSSVSAATARTHVIKYDVAGVCDVSLTVPTSVKAKYEGNLGTGATGIKNRHLYLVGNGLSDEVTCGSLKVVKSVKMFDAAKCAGPIFNPGFTSLGGKYYSPEQTKAEVATDCILSPAFLLGSLRWASNSSLNVWTYYLTAVRGGFVALSRLNTHGSSAVIDMNATMAAVATASGSISKGDWPAYNLN